MTSFRRLACTSPSLLLLAGALAAADSAASSAETVVVTADRQDGTRERTTATIDVVDAQDQRDLGHPADFWSALRTVPGTDVLGTSGGVDGGNVGIRLRGGNGSDTRVLVDGIPLGDPTDVQGNTNLAWLGGAGLERIEVVRGGQSGLYGSRAVTGVVNLLTIRPTPEHHADALVEGGSFGTGRATAAASGPLAGGLGYAVAVGGLTSNGFSAKTSPGADGDAEDHERDGLRRLNATARVEAAVAPGTTLYVAGRSDATNQDYDGFGATGPEAENLARIRLWRGAAGGEGQWGKVRAAVDVARTATKRTHVEDGATDDDIYRGRQDYAAGRLAVDVLAPQAARTTAIDRATLTVGGDTTSDRADITTAFSDFHESEHLTGVWGQALVGDRWAELSATARSDRHDREGRTGTWRLGAALFPLADADGGPLKLHGAIGTTFRAPSLYELYDPFSGNPDLAAQRARDWEAGAEAKAAGLSVGSTYFRTDYRESLEFSPVSFTYVNGGSYRSDGIENRVGWNDDGEGLRAALAYTWQRTSLTDEDVQGGRGFTLLPRHKAVFSPSWHDGVWWIGATVTAVGRRQGSVFSAQPDLHGYCLLGAAAGYQPAPGWELYVRGENLGDASYVVNDGYSTAPRAGYAGVTAEF